MKRLFLFTCFLALTIVFAGCSSNPTAKEPAKEEKQVQPPSQEATTDSNKLFVYGDVVSQLGGCVLQSRFEPGDKIVFRVNVKDAADNQVENAKVTVNLSTGEKLEMKLAPHPPDKEGAEKFWTVAYPITAQTQKGTLDYFVSAEADGKSGEYRPFKVAPSLLTIVDPAQIEAEKQSK